MHPKYISQFLVYIEKRRRILHFQNIFARLCPILVLGSSFCKVCYAIVKKDKMFALFWQKKDKSEAIVSIYKTADFTKISLNTLYFVLILQKKLQPNVPFVLLNATFLK